MRRLLVKLYDWQACADSVDDGRSDGTDLIFALAGREVRKKYALGMFLQGRAPQLLLSVGRYEIRHFDRLQLPDRVNLLPMAHSVRPPLRHFFVHFGNGSGSVELIPRGRFGTMSEVRALGRWLESRDGIKSISIVSSATHLRRVQLCCRTFLPDSLQFRLLSSDDEGEALIREAWWRNEKTRFIVLAEFLKLILYRTVLAFERPLGQRTFQRAAG